MKTQRAILLTAFYAFAALYFTRATVFVEQTRSDLALAICIAIAVTLACIADSKILGTPMLHTARWVMLFTWPVAVPIYLLWARGKKGVVPLLVHGVAFCVLWIGIPFVAIGLLQIEPR